MMIQVVLIVGCLTVSSFTAPVPGEILNYDTQDHKHSQSGIPGSAVKGSYSHTDADGKIYTVHYEADDNGYRATGQHLPVLSQVKTEQTGAATVIHMTPVMPTFPYAYPLAPFPPLVYNIPHSYTYTF